MVEYKSDTFVFFIYVFVVITLIAKLTAFFMSWNPLNLVTPTVATIVGVFLIRKDVRVVSYIRLWAIIEIAAASLLAASKGCNILLRENEPLTAGEYVSIGLAVLLIAVASAFYFLAPDYIVEKQTEQKAESIFDLMRKQGGAP